MIEIQARIRGQNITFFATDFYEDLKEGYELGPANFYAQTLYGEYFELTRNETVGLIGKANDAYRANSEHFIMDGG